MIESVRYNQATSIYQGRQYSCIGTEACGEDHRFLLANEVCYQPLNLDMQIKASHICPCYLR